MTLALLIPGVGMGGSGVANLRGTYSSAGFEYMLIYPDTVLFPDDVIAPDGVLGARGSRRAPGTVGSRGASGSAGAGGGRN